MILQFANLFFSWHSRKLKPHEYYQIYIIGRPDESIERSASSQRFNSVYLACTQRAAMRYILIFSSDYHGDEAGLIILISSFKFFSNGKLNRGWKGYKPSFLIPYNPN